MKAVAKQFPKTHFAIVDVSNADEGGLKNVQGLLFKEQEAGYLAGYAAGLAAQAARRARVVSSVGGQKQPPVDRYIAGFQAGAKAADPGVKTLVGYSQDFENQAKCKEVALNQIAAGSVVVFQVAGGCGLGALDAAKEKGVWGVGVDADQGYLGTYVLTSALKRVDTAVYDSIRDAKNGKFKGGQDSVYGLDVGGVGIGKFSPKAPAGIAAKVAQVKRRSQTARSRTSRRSSNDDSSPRRHVELLKGEPTSAWSPRSARTDARRRVSSGSTPTARTSSSTRRTSAPRAATCARTRASASASGTTRIRTATSRSKARSSSTTKARRAHPRALAPLRRQDFTRRSTA